MKRNCLIPVIALVVVAGCLGVAAAGFLFTRPATAPTVSIEAPNNGELVGVNQELVIHAIARSEQKIKRIEVWVDGALRDAETSSVPGGVSPFPIVATWSPAISGTHSIVVRAYSPQNTRGNASIQIEAQSSTDRDGDSVPDVTDGCPDQPGLMTDKGCPVITPGDRDGDGVADAEDLCPDQPGTTLSSGCPDADRDGVQDGVDACPGQAGATASGCPTPGDADGDGIADGSDACAHEAGVGTLGGCPDRDGDGVRDIDDACPDEAGAVSAAGCPDGDGDGVRDAVDLCPTTPGLAANGGCPSTGARDSDGDGIADGTDLAPGEAGPADAGGAPQPGGGLDSDGDGIPDAEEGTNAFGGGLGLLAPGIFQSLKSVEIQALEFQVSGDYTSISCYATIGGGAAEHIGPLAPLGARRWDIGAFWGPMNSRRFLASASQPLQVHVECGGIAGETRTAPEPGTGIGEGGTSGTYYDLGSFTGSHDLSAAPSIQEQTVGSTGGDAGQSFHVKYRVCTPGCKSPVLPAPAIRLTHVADVNSLWWEWAGHSYDISGFKLYMNGSYHLALDERASYYFFTSKPACGDRYDIQLSAYRGNPGRPEIESPLSNTETWDGGFCPRTATVTFDKFDTRNLGLDDAPPGFVGPIKGSFWVNDERRSFDGPQLLRSNASFYVGHFCPNNQITVELDPSDSLTIGGRIEDKDLGANPNEVLFDSALTLLPQNIGTGNQSFTAQDGNTLRVHIDVRDQ